MARYRLKDYLQLVLLEQGDSGFIDGLSDFRRCLLAEAHWESTALYASVLLRRQGAPTVALPG